jgi:hypothetical protein
MNWFHPIGGPVLLLPAVFASRWRGQHPDRGYSAAHDAVTAGLGGEPWVGLDVGGLALADQGAIGVITDDGAARIVIRRNGASDRIAATVGAAATVAPTGKHIPWPGGPGLLFDAVENGDVLEDGLTTPLPVALPAGPLAVATGEVHESGLDLFVIELRPAG